MSSRFLNATGAAAIAAMLAFSSQASAQSDDADLEMRIQRLENQLRQLTGQNEELQYRNRQLEERLRQLGGGAAASPAASPRWRSPASLRFRPRCSPVRRRPASRKAQPTYEQPQIAAPAPIMQEQAAAPAAGRRRGDAFDPNAEPERPRRAARARRRPVADRQ